MKKKPIDIRKTLSQNIKNHRELLGLSQEKLSEKAKISANMIRDIGKRKTTAPSYSTSPKPSKNSAPISTPALKTPSNCGGNLRLSRQPTAKIKGN